MIEKRSIESCNDQNLITLPWLSSQVSFTAPTPLKRYCSPKVIAHQITEIADSVCLDQGSLAFFQLFVFLHPHELDLIAKFGQQ